MTVGAVHDGEETQVLCGLGGQAAWAKTRGPTRELSKCLKTMVGERGFEPPTPWSRTRFLPHAEQTSKTKLEAPRVQSVIDSHSPQKILKVGLPLRAPEKKAGKGDLALGAVSFLRSGTPKSCTKFRPIPLVSATVLENFSTVQTVWRRRVNANFRYNFAYLCKVRIFIRLGVLILNGNCWRILFRQLAYTKQSGFPDYFLAKETRLWPPSKEDVQPNVSRGIGGLLATTDCPHSIRTMRTLSPSTISRKRSSSMGRFRSKRESIRTHSSQDN